MKNRILILSVSRKVALIKAFKSAGWFVVGQDLDPNAVALKFCDEIAKSDTEIGFDLAIPTRDGELLEWSNHPATIMPSNETIRICRDKLMLGKIIEDIGLKTPKVMFCKPQDGAGSRNSIMMYQEYINLPQFSIDAFCDREGVPVNIVPRSRDKVVDGESWISTTIEAPKLISTMIHLLTKLKLVGHSVTQCFWDGVGEPIIFDCNARFGGQSNLAIQAGCNSPKYMLDLINGKEVKPEIGNYKRNLKVYSYREDLFVQP